MAQFDWLYLKILLEGEQMGGMGGNEIDFTYFLVLFYLFFGKI
jgi:hypothetical protein